MRDRENTHASVREEFVQFLDVPIEASAVTKSEEKFSDDDDREDELRRFPEESNDALVTALQPSVGVGVEEPLRSQSSGSTFSKD